MFARVLEASLLLLLQFLTQNWRGMRRATAYSNDGCRGRYDNILFAAERCQADGRGEEPSSERRWMLELGAMSVLEAELETFRLDRASAERVSRENDGGDQGNGSEQEQVAYRSCLEMMLDDHYDALCEFSPLTIPSGVRIQQHSTHHKATRNTQHAEATMI